MIPLFAPPPAVPMRHPTSFPPAPAQHMPIPHSLLQPLAPTTQEAQYQQNMPAPLRPLDPVIDAPPSTGTVTISQLATLRSSTPATLDPLAVLGAPQHHALSPAPSAPTLLPPSQPQGSQFVQGFQNFASSPSLSAPPSSGGTVTFSFNSASQAIQHPSSRQAFVHLNTMLSSSNGIDTARAPNGIGTFASFSIVTPPPASTTPSQPPPTAAASQFTQSSMTGNMYFGPSHAYDNSQMTVLSQPAISISVCDPTTPSTPPAAPRRGIVTAKTSGGYIPAPGQAMVNMDKTTLFTPANPPRPGSPRTPRTPKSPKSPGGPTTVPHSPKSPKPDT